MEKIEVKKLNEVWSRIDTEEGVEHELSDHFCFDVPGARWSEKYKRGRWDGKIRLFNRRTKRIYTGLVDDVERFAEEKGYEFEKDFDYWQDVDYDLLERIYRDIDKERFNKDQLDYQLKTFLYCVKRGRGTIESPTASGKSFIIYLICLYYLEHLEDPRILITVPKTSLVNQMATDFEDYSDGATERDVHQVTGGVEKVTDKRITVSTWQSIYKMGEDYFEDFDVVIADECHEYEAKSLCSMVEKTTSSPYRFGFTGTLRETKTNEMTLHGLFGPVKKFVSTSDLIDMDVLSDITIECVLMSYPDEDRKKLYGSAREYMEELDFIVSHPKRLKFTSRVAAEGWEGNTLVLFYLVDAHGIPLYEEIERTYGHELSVHLVHGGVGAEERNEIRARCEETDDNIVVASYGTYSTGINIRNLHRIVFASPYKSKIKVMQSIGRGLRKHESKKKLSVIDLVDDLKWNDRMNHTLKGFMQRIRMYNEEDMNYNIHQVEF